VLLFGIAAIKPKHIDLLKFLAISFSAFFSDVKELIPLTIETDNES